jgi:suppressor for copper-sensitivity B
MVSLLALRRQGAIPALAGTLMTGIAALAIVLPPQQSRPTARDTTGDVQWQPFVPQGIDEMVQNGRTVFVNIGAAWCVTCKVNDAVIAGSNAIRDRLTSDVVPIRADWTRHDAALGAYLQSFHRYGLPFDVVFGPGAPTGIVLPELLTQTAVLAAIDQASTKLSTSH